MLRVEKAKKVSAVVNVPPSKAHSLRAILIAAVTPGRSRIIRPLLAKDQLFALLAIGKLGAKVKENKKELVITGVPKFRKCRINVGSSGFAARALMALAATSAEEIVVDGSAQLRKRPVRELGDALVHLGARVHYLGRTGFLPVAVRGPLKGGTITLDSRRSSQFLSALLIAAPLASSPVTIKVKKLVSRPYVDLTIEVMRAFGVRSVSVKGSEFSVLPQAYSPAVFRIEGDYSAAAFLLEAAAITGGRIGVNNLPMESMQGDRRVLDILKKMGCIVRQMPDFLSLRSTSRLKPVIADMRGCPDIVPPVAVACAFADGKSILKSVSHLRFKESDRLKSLILNLEKMGAKARVVGNDLVVHGSAQLKGAEIEPFDDHRIAMAFAAAGLRTGGMRIKDPECVNKSFPDFWRVLAEITK